MKLTRILTATLLIFSLFLTGNVTAEVSFQNSQTANAEQIIIIGELPAEVKSYIPPYFAELGLEQKVIFSDQIQMNIESNMALAETNEIAPTQLFNKSFKTAKNQVILLGHIPTEIQRTIEILVASIGVDVDLVFANSVRAGATLEVVRENPGIALFAEPSLSGPCFGHYIADGSANLTGDREGDRVAARVKAVNNWKAKAPLQARRGGFSGQIDLNPDFQLVSCSSSEKLKKITCKVRAEVCALNTNPENCN